MDEIETRATPTTQADSEHSPREPRANVLLIDDQPARLMSYEAILSGIGVRCVCALSVQQALGALRTDAFAVIILDIHMPEMGGLEVARLIRGHPRYEQTPIIFVTEAQVGEFDRLKRYQAGVIDYLTIPVVPEVLRSKVAVLAELHHRRCELTSLNQALDSAREQAAAQHAQEATKCDAQLSRLFEHPTDLLAILRAQRSATGAILDWVYLNANKNALCFLGETRESLRGASLSRVLPHRAVMVAALAERVLASGEPVSYEGRVGERQFLVTIWGIDDDCVAVSSKDITDRKRAEDALRENERRSRALIENAPVAVAHSAPDGRFEYVNKGFCELLGYTAQELLSKTWQEVTHPEDLVTDLALAQKVMSGEMPFYKIEKRYLRKDGTSVWVSLFGNFVLDESGKVLQGLTVAVDITARREAQQRLHESERRFRELANNIDQLAWMCNELGVVDWYNDRWYEYTGRTFEEMRGRGWKKLHDPEHLERVTDSLQRSLKTGEPWEDTFPLRGKDGQYRWFLSRATPIRDCNGRVVRWFGTNTDVTELRRLQVALRETDRRKDEFLAMLSHELRNPVAPIRNAAEVLARISTHDERQAALVGIIQRQTEHFARMLDDLLDVARITQGRIALQREIIPLSACIEMAVETAQPEIRDREHELTVVHDSQPLHVNADRVRLTLCLANLLSNAAKYTPPGGHIRVRSYALSDSAVVQVIDDGKGISAELLPHVFELFVQGERSVDRTQGGLGIGLSICKPLIEMHGGTVEAYSAGPGRGSTFTIRLPLSKEQSSEPSPLPGAASAAARRVLIVDDNHDAANTLAVLLQVEGHTTRVVYSAESAIEAAGDFRPDVVLLDIGLPRMDGYQVARVIRQSLPDVRLVALTGYGQAEDRRRSADAGFDAHLLKPIDWKDLQATIGGR